MQTYARQPVNFVKGQGARLWDTEDRCYLDALGGIAVCALGHAHPAVTEAIRDQAGKLLHTSNLYGIEYQQQLADRLSEISGMQRTFFCNSGAEANEAAIKIARRYGNLRNIEKPQIIVMENSFHGRTLATLAATGNSKAQQGFEPLPTGFLRVPYDDINAIKQLAAEHNDIVAILVEPIQGEGGINIPADGYLQSLRQLCDQHGWLLMLDEIQTGIGRTGRWFAFQHENILPDVLTSAKALGNGIPVGACLARGEAADILQPGMHGTTFGGNPFATRVALTVIETIATEKLVERAAELGQRFLTHFRTELAGRDNVVDIRGKGMMLGITLNRPCGELVGTALEAGLLINVTAGNVIRLLPPYVLNDTEAAELETGVCQLIQDFPAVASV